MSHHFKLKAEVREGTGTATVKEIAPSGHRPGCALTVEASAPTRCRSTPRKSPPISWPMPPARTSWSDLVVEGAKDINKLVLIQAVQHNTLSRAITHIDFQAVREDRGNQRHGASLPVGRADRGQARRSSRSPSPPSGSALPAQGSPRVPHLRCHHPGKWGSALHVGEVTFPKGVAPTTGHQVVIALIAETRTGQAGRDSLIHAVGGESMTPSERGETKVRLVVGLGNPGLAYVDTRHNVGFMIAERFCRRCRRDWSTEKRWDCRVARVGDTWIIKPQTFMDLSGRSVSKVAAFYKFTPRRSSRSTMTFLCRWAASGCAPPERRWPRWNQIDDRRTGLLGLSPAQGGHRRKPPGRGVGGLRPRKILPRGSGNIGKNAAGFRGRLTMRARLRTERGHERPQPRPGTEDTKGGSQETSRAGRESGKLQERNRRRT